MLTMRPSALSASVALLLCACRDSPSGDAGVRVDSLPGGILRTITSHPIDSGRWHLVAVRDIQPAESDSAELANPADVAIAHDGTVLVADVRPATIKVFNPTGALVRTIGREGSGPGEFHAAYIAVRGDTLVVQDSRNVRATSFNWRTGALLSERRTACCYYFPIGIDGTGRAAVRSILPPRDSTLPNAQAFVRFAINGTAVDTVDVPAGQRRETPRRWVVREGNVMRMTVPVPFEPRAFHAIDPSGGFVTGFSSEYLLRRSATGLDTTALFGRDWSPTSVSATEKTAIVERRVAEVSANNSDIAPSTIRASFDAASIPDTRPAFEGLWLDADGRTWVRRTDADSTVVRFDLFDRQGRWLDVLSIPAGDWPRSSWIPMALGKREVAVPLEDEDGRPLIRVFRIERR